ncbi:MAG: hypothetical protein QCH31_05985 [Methanolobus sp.]|nr:hypothetical protein [Methanolobus sp.]
MKTYHNYFYAILAICLVVLAITGSGCISEPDNDNGDINIPEQTGSEAEQQNDDSTEAEHNDQNTPDAAQTDEQGSDMTLPAGQTEQSSTSDTPPQSVPELTLQASALGEGKYMLEHKGGDDMDLAEVRMVLSSHGSTGIYSPLSKNEVIMSTGDRLVIDVISESFTINDREIDVTDPQTTDASAGDTKIWLYPKGSNEIIIYKSISG